MLAAHHLNKNVDVQKHKLVYKRIRVTLSGKATPQSAKKSALDYFENLGALMLFRELPQEKPDVCEFEGLCVVLEN